MSMPTEHDGLALAPDVGIDSRSATGLSANAWVMTTVVMLAVMVAFFDRINIAVMFTNADFQESIGVVNNPALMGLLMSGFVFAYGVSMLLFSVVGDVFGPRRALAGISFVLAIVMALMGMVSSYALMLSGRIALGAVEGPQYGSGTAAVKQWFPIKNHSVANAIWVSGGPLSQAIGFPLVIFLVANYGWRVSFFVLAAFDAALVLPILWVLKDGSSGLRSEPRRSPVQPQRTIPMLTAVGTFLRDWQFWMIMLFDCGVVTFLFGFSSWLPSYLEKTRHFNVLHTGLYSALPFLLQIVGCFAGSLLADRFQRRALVCLLGMPTAALLIYLAMVAPNANWAAWLLGFSGMFWGATIPTMFAIGQSVIPKEVTAAGLGVYGGIASLTAGAIAPYAMGKVIAEAGYSAGMIAMAVACALFSLSMIPLLKRY